MKRGIFLLPALLGILLLLSATLLSTTCYGSTSHFDNYSNAVWSTTFRTLQRTLRIYTIGTDDPSEQITEQVNSPNFVDCSITLGAFPVICQTTTAAYLPYTATDANGYSIEFDAAANTAGIGDVGNAGLPAAPNSIQINIPYGVAAGTYNGVLTLRFNSTVCSAVTYPFTVTVHPVIVVQFSQACQGGSPTFIRVLVSNAPSGSYLVKNGGTTVVGPTANGTITSFNGTVGTTYSVIDAGSAGASCTTTFTTTNLVTCNETTCNDNSLFDLKGLGYTKPSFIGQNGNFNAVIGGTFTTDGSADTEGRMAVGGNFVNTGMVGGSYTIGQASGSGALNAPSGSDNLIVSGNIIGAANVRGNAVYGNGTAPGVTFIGGNTGLKRSFPGTVSTNVLDIAGSILAFRNRSLSLSTCVQGNIGTVTGLTTPTVTFDGLNQPGLVKFILPSAPASTSYNFINVGSASNILINVIAAPSVTFSLSSIYLNGVPITTPLSGSNLAFAEKVLWNFPNSLTTSFSLANYALIGSVLAPYSNANLFSGSINGQAVFGGDVAQSGSFEFHNFCFNGNIPDCPLPIELYSFTGKQVNNAIKLIWKTASEKNNAYMEVQRSKDGINFVSLGDKKGHGTTRTGQQYDWMDESPFAGINYYRLRQVDLDGKYEYHQVIAVPFAQQKTPTLTIYPTVTKDQVQIVWNEALEGDEALIVTDMIGRLVLQLSLTGNTLDQPLNVQGLTPGHYIATIRSKRATVLSRFVKQ